MIERTAADQIAKAGQRPPAPAAGVPARPGGASFGDVLAQKLDAAPIRFSGHALQRIERRGISVDAAVMARLGEGVSRAAAKGSRDSVVLVDQTAFVVSVPNRTVITAVDREHMREHVFTNIDSAVIS
ncbi:MAG TPA: TIGR02530 family flagellar biosynthesis protein [Gaiellales bacterium]|nr:TIGR02530 family flagellar biosynthesis protein [Gaiellales bacterium]